MKRRTRIHHECDSDKKKKHQELVGIEGVLRVSIWVSVGVDRTSSWGGRVDYVSILRETQ